LLFGSKPALSPLEQRSLGVTAQGYSDRYQSLTIWRLENGQNAEVEPGTLMTHQKGEAYGAAFPFFAPFSLFYISFSGIAMVGIGQRPAFQI